MPNQIHTITVLNDAKELVGKMVKVVSIPPRLEYLHYLIGDVGIYQGRAAIQFDSFTKPTEFYWGLQIQEVGDE
jgi:hypothetical protein